MATMNAFKSNAFSTTSLSGVVEKMEYVPGLLGSLNIFDAMPVRTRDLFVDRREGKLALISNSALGAPPEQLEVDDRTAVPLKTTRLAKSFTLYATEVDGIRAFGSESEQEAVQSEYIRRMSRLRTDMDATHELHRLGALQGKLLDADGTTVIYDYFTAFDEAETAAVAFALGTNTTNVRGKCMEVSRAIQKAGKGSYLPGSSVHALAGDEFFDKLIDHPTVRETYLNYAAAADLRENKAFQSFNYGGIVWHNYRGQDEAASPINIATGEAKFFPVGARDVFKKAMAPMESINFVGTPGRDVYATNVLDPGHPNDPFWTRGEMYSYPLYFCQRPGMLRKATTN